VVTEAEASDLSRMSAPGKSPQPASSDDGMRERDCNSDCVISFVFDWLSSEVVHVRFIVGKMALVLASNAELWFSLLNVISPVLDMHGLIHLFIYLSLTLLNLPTDNIKNTALRNIVSHILCLLCVCASCIHAQISHYLSYILRFITHSDDVGRTNFFTAQENF
jgi:hypothetical protein